MMPAIERSRSPLFITRIAAFTAIGVVVGLALAAVPNVEGVTAVCFIAGFLLGPLAGFFCGALTETLFAGFHPMGSSIGFTLLAQVLGMSITGIIGGIAGRFCGVGSSTRKAITIVMMGVAATIQFDLLTNLAYVIMAGFSFSQAFLVYAAALPFAVIHLISNLLVFAIIVVPLLPRLERTLVLS
jgi:energy-coupling factor transport system substrate-specific component